MKRFLSTDLDVDQFVRSNLSLWLNSESGWVTTTDIYAAYCAHCQQDPTQPTLGQRAFVDTMKRVFPALISGRIRCGAKVLRAWRFISDPYHHLDVARDTFDFNVEFCTKNAMELKKCYVKRKQLAAQLEAFRVLGITFAGISTVLDLDEHIDIVVRMANGTIKDHLQFQHGYRATDCMETNTVFDVDRYFDSIKQYIDLESVKLEEVNTINPSDDKVVVANVERCIVADQHNREGDCQSTNPHTHIPTDTHTHIPQADITQTNASTDTHTHVSNTHTPQTAMQQTLLKIQQNAIPDDDLPQVIENLDATTDDEIEEFILTLLPLLQHPKKIVQETTAAVLSRFSTDPLVEQHLSEMPVEIETPKPPPEVSKSADEEFKLLEL